MHGEVCRGRINPIGNFGHGPSTTMFGQPLVTYQLLLGSTYDRGPFHHWRHSTMCYATMRHDEGTSAWLAQCWHLLPSILPTPGHTYAWPSARRRQSARALGGAAPGPAGAAVSGAPCLSPTTPPTTPPPDLSPAPRSSAAAASAAGGPRCALWRSWNFTTKNRTKRKLGDSQ